jgi:1,2-diacylglycerol 3-alpha-glucosyltransferase
MRILIATSSNYAAFHGQAIFTKNLAEGLVRRGHDVLVVAGSESGTEYQTINNGVTVSALKSVSLRLLNPNAILAIFTEKAMRGNFITFRPEIVHIQDHYPLCRSAIRMAKLRGVKTVGTNHFMPENLAAYIPLISKIKPIYNWVMWHWMRGVYDRLDAIVAPSKTAAEMLQTQAVRPPVFPISCGANTAIFCPIPNVDRRGWRIRYGIDPDRKVFFFVGRVDPEKRLDVFLRAANMLDRSDFQVVIAGNGANVFALKKLSRDLRLMDRVHFTGFIPNDDLPSLLNSIDIFVMPGEAELLSIATIQAMACCRPILAADAVALPELVVNNVNGLLFHPGNATDLARCMVWLADHPDYWTKMGAASLERAQKHRIEKIVAEYETLYRSVIIGTHPEHQK